MRGRLISRRGGNIPASCLDTLEGQKLIANLLSIYQSGAYA